MQNPKTFKPSRKQLRYFELARNVSHQSTYGKLSHGSVLVKGGCIINTGFNKKNFCSFGTRFRSPKDGLGTLHAEIAAVLGMPKSMTEGASIYVVRTNNNDLLRLSAPCPMCRQVLMHCGIRRAYYSTSQGTFEVIKL